MWESSSVGRSSHHALWDRSTLVSQDIYVNICQYLQHFTTCTSFQSLLNIENHQITKHHISMQKISRGQGLTASILSFSAAISACGKAEQWPEALHLLARCEHLDHLDAWQNTQQKNGENKNSNMIWHWFDYITGAIGIQSKIFQVFKIIASLCLELYKSEKKTGSDHLQFCHQCLCKSSSMDEGNGSLGEKYAIHPRSSSQLLEVMVEMSFLSMYEIYRNMWKISGIVGTQ